MSSLYEPCAICDGTRVEEGYVLEGIYYEEDKAPVCPEHGTGPT